MLKFAEGIKKFYLEIVIPYYDKKSKLLQISK